MSQSPVRIIRPSPPGANFKPVSLGQYRERTALGRALALLEERDGLETETELLISGYESQIIHYRSVEPLGQWTGDAGRLLVPGLDQQTRWFLPFPLPISRCQQGKEKRCNMLAAHPHRA
ncbi:hypothetical protein RZ533_24105 [Sphingobium yanoikuyae]|nr:hypothetical protein [Sphingobium yanoikuyae]